MAHCPNCQKENPAGIVKCDCGYDHLTGEIVPGGAPAAATEGPAMSAAGPRADQGNPREMMRRDVSICPDYAISLTV